MYEIYYKESKFLRTRVAKVETMQDVEDLMRNRCNWERYQLKTPNGIIEMRKAGLNPF